MDWYSLWNQESDLPRRQHWLSLALRIIGGASAAGGIVLLFHEGWPEGLLPLTYGLVGFVLMTTSALALDTLILATRVLYAWRGEFKAATNRAEIDRERQRQEAA